MIDLKRHNKIATLRRLVALTMLCALLFTNTSVYADTTKAEEPADTTATETAKSSADETVSTATTGAAEESTEASDADAAKRTVKLTLDTTEDIDVESEELDMASILTESKIETPTPTVTPTPTPSGEPPCEHENLEEEESCIIDSTTAGQHIVGHWCEDCGEFVPSGAPVKCTSDGKTYIRKSTDKKHIEYKKCSVCGRDFDEKSVNCTLKVEAYRSTSNEKHMVYEKCSVCKNTYQHEEDCVWESEEGNPNYYHCSKATHGEIKNGCTNIKDERSHDVVISNVTVTPEAKAENVKENYTYFDEKIVIEFDVACEVLNKVSEDDFKHYVNAYAAYTDYYSNKVKTINCKLISYDKGVARYQLRSEDVNTDNEPFYISYIAAESKFDKNVKPATHKLDYFLDYCDPAKQVSKLSKSIVSGDGSTYKEGTWYSKHLHSEKNLFVSYKGVTTEKISNPVLWELDEAGNPATKVKVVKSECVDKSIRIPTIFFGDIVFPYYENNYEYELELADTDESEHRYEFRFEVKGKEFKQPVVTTKIDNVAPKLKLTFDNNKFENEKYYKKDRKATFVLVDKNIDSSIKNNVVINSREGSATINEMTGSNGSYTGSIDFNEDGIYSIGDIRFTDYAGNAFVFTDDTDKNYCKEFVIDKTAPTLKITFNDVKPKNEKYYKEDRIATFVLEDRNIDTNEAKMDYIKVHTKEGKVTKVNEMTGSNGKYVGSVVFADDGIYSIGEIKDLKLKDKAGNEIKFADGQDMNYSSEFVIDKTAPKLDKITYSKPTSKTGRYYKNNVDISVLVSDRNLSTDTYIGTKLDGKSLEKQVNLSKVEDNSATINYVAEAEGKHVLTGKIYDMAGNFTEINDTDKEFIIDKTAPTVEKITYSDPTGRTGRFYKNDVQVSVKINDLYLSADSYITTVLGKTSDAESGEKANLAKDTNGAGTIDLTVKKESEHKLVGEIFDMAGNCTKINDTENAFEIDKTVPVIDVKFDNNSALNGNYFKAARKAEITFTEKNFSSEAEYVKVAKNSSEQNLVPNLQSYSKSGNKNVTHITFDADGRYGFNIVVEDKAGNLSEKYVSEDFVIDLTAPELEINGVTDMSANNGKVAPVIVSKDTNLTDASTEISLVGSNRGKVTPSITKTNGTEVFTYAIADMAREKDNDDLYTLSVKLTDLAGNVVEKTVKYSLNRFGSVFVLSEGTKAMVDGYYVTKPHDVVITEINVDSLTKKEVSVAHDGDVKELREGASFTTNDKTTSNGWHSISYNVDKSNFNKDGIYSVTVYSEDKATNKQSNQSKDTEVEFLLDQTAPSVIVSGLEDGGIYEEESHDFSINAADTIGVTDMKVYLNDEKLASYTADELNANGGTVVLTVPSKDDYQKVTIECSDVVGNVTKLAYNNLLVSVKAEELLLEDDLTPTSKLDENTPVGAAMKNASKTFGIIGILAAIAVVAGLGAFALKKKQK